MRNVTVIEMAARLPDGSNESYVVGVFSSIPKAREAIEQYKLRYALKYPEARLRQSDTFDYIWTVHLPDGERRSYIMRKMRVNGALI